MGMKMSQLGASFKIKRAHRKRALAAIQALPAAKYRWVDEDFRDCKTIGSMLEAWGWSVETNVHGDIFNITFERSKIGDEDGLFKAIAPHVEAGSWIEVECEGVVGHDRFRWVFDGETCARDYDEDTWQA